MMRTQAIRIVFLVTVASLGMCVAPHLAGGEEQQHQSSLRIGTIICPTNKGHVLLRFHIANYGDKTVNVGWISASSDGQFTCVGQDIESGATLEWRMIVDREPTFVTLETSEGKFRFPIRPTEKE